MKAKKKSYISQSEEYDLMYGHNKKDKKKKKKDKSDQSSGLIKLKVLPDYYSNVKKDKDGLAYPKIS